MSFHIFSFQTKSWFRAVLSPHLWRVFGRESCHSRFLGRKKFVKREGPNTAIWDMQVLFIYTSNVKSCLRMEIHGWCSSHKLIINNTPKANLWLIWMKFLSAILRDEIFLPPRIFSISSPIPIFLSPPCCCYVYSPRVLDIACLPCCRFPRGGRIRHNTFCVCGGVSKSNGLIRPTERERELALDERIWERIFLRKDFFRVIVYQYKHPD